MESLHDLDKETLYDMLVDYTDIMIDHNGEPAAAEAKTKWKETFAALRHKEGKEREKEEGDRKECCTGSDAGTTGQR